MNNLSLDNIVVKHWIKFDYDVSCAIVYEHPHFIFNIEDSIIYKSLISNNFEDYNKLINTTNQFEHSESIFMKLKDSFSVGFLEQPDNQIKLYWHRKLQKYIIKDGCHRMALIKFFNLDDEGKLPRRWFSIEGKRQ